MHRVETTYNNELQPKADQLRLVNYLAVPPPHQEQVGRGTVLQGGRTRLGQGIVPARRRWPIQREWKLC